MTHALEEVQLNRRLGRPALSRPVVPNHRTRAAQQANALPATRKVAGTLSMRWSTGVDGLLSCAWHPPIPWETNQTEAGGGPGWLAVSGSVLSDRMAEALAAAGPRVRREPKTVRSSTNGSGGSPQAAAR